MKYSLSVLFILNVCTLSYSQKLNNSDFSKLSIYLETNITPIASQNTNTIHSYQGQLALEYNLFSKVQLGIFGQTLLYHQNTEIANIDNKIIDLSSIEYNTLGISTGYKSSLKKIVIYPKLDFGYNFFLAKSLDFETDKKEFLDYRYFSITPKLNLGYAITDGFSLGLNFGYNKQLLALKGKLLEEFNPSSFTAGIFGYFIIK